MVKSISDKLTQLKASETVLFDAKVKSKEALGERIISLVTGDPVEGTPSSICQGAIEAIQKNQTKYGASAGLIQLRESVSQKLKKDNQLNYSPKQIVISSGVKQSVSVILTVLLNIGDEVIIPSPYWVTYPNLVSLCSAKPIIIEGSFENNLKLTPEQLENSITPRTKLVILNSPNNPTGVVYTKDELQALSNIILKYDLYCLSDEIYEKIIYGQAEHFSIAACSGMLERTIVVNGFSKAYAMTGWRLGYSASPTLIATAISHFQSQSSHHPSMISQYAGLVALQQEVEFPKQLKQSLEFKKKNVENILNTIENIQFQSPQGAFYFLIDIQYYLKRSFLKDSKELSIYLLENYGIGVMSGSAFGKEGMIRISFTASESDLKQGLKLLKQGLESLTSI